MAKIRSRYDAYCSEATCGAFLPAGSLVRYYGRNGIYGVGCHTKSESTQGKHSRFREAKQSEHRGSRYPGGDAENGPAVWFNTPCGHEDYPCCGCSDEYNQRIG